MADSAYSERQRVIPESPFMQELLGRPLDHASVPEIAALLRVTGREQEARQLIHADRRRSLAALTGEQFEAHTVRDAIGGQWPTSDGSEAQVRAGARVQVSDPGPEVRRTSPISDGYRSIGAGIWLQELPTHAMVQMLYVVRNGLRMPITRADLDIESPTTRPDYSDNTRLNCKPEGTESFAPDVAQVAICEGPVMMTAATTKLAALAKRAGPVRVLSVGTPELHDAHTWEYFADTSLDARAREMIMKLPCKEKGTCASILTAEAHEEMKRSAHTTILGLAALAAILALGVALVIKPKGNAGWPLSLLSVVVVIFALLGVGAMWASVRPGASYEAFLTFGFLYFGAVPYLLLVLMLVVSALSGNTRRLHTFGAAFGVLVAASLVAVFRMSM